MEVIAGERVDPGAAAPIGAETRAEPVVRPAGLSLDLMARRAATRSGRVTVKIIEARNAGCDRHLVDEGDGVGQRELQPATTAAAEESAAAKAAASSAKAPASAAAATPGSGRRSAGIGRWWWAALGRRR